MNYTLYLDSKDLKSLIYERVPSDLKIYLTRLLEVKIERRAQHSDRIYFLNQVINLSRQLVGKTIYVLDTHGEEYYYSQEYGWHDSEFHLVFRRLGTIEFIEFLCDLIHRKFFEIDEVNDILKRANLSFHLEEKNDLPFPVIMKDEDLESLVTEIQTDQSAQSTHANIRVMLLRADRNLKAKDYSGLLSDCSMIFETLAKDVIDSPKAENKSFGKFIELYKKESKLPQKIVEFIESIYIDRNRTPLAAHGSRNIGPSISHEESVFLLEVTKAIVVSEYKLIGDQSVEISIAPAN